MSVKDYQRNQLTVGFGCITVHDAVEQRTDILFGEVHVWGVSLEVDESQISRIESCLSFDERERASRLLSSQHRRQFVAAHGALRIILSRYCQTRPKDLHLQRTSAGKPFLADPFSDNKSLRFNLTHSHGRALIVVAKAREIGVDLERIRPKIDVMRLAHRFFSLKDQEFILRGEPSARQERFLQVWVAREAVSKAKGSGITFPLNRDHVEIDLDAGDGQLMGTAQVMNGKQIVFRLLPMEAQWVGAVAAEGTDWRLKLCH
jgi:4'-phosphopantetheinyl transferase